MNLIFSNKKNEKDCIPQSFGNNSRECAKLWNGRRESIMLWKRLYLFIV